MYEGLSNIKIRYLNCRIYDIKLKLKHPEELISATLRFGKLVGMNECVNLRNLYSENVTYTKDDVLWLQNLRRLYSFDDVYKGGECTLTEELFRSSKP